jgi:hypothetical protein
VLTDDEPRVTVNAGDNTVSGSLAVGVYEPLVPVIVMLPVPAAAVVAAVTVTVALAPVFTLAALKLTVMPVEAVAFRATVPL